MPVSTNKGVPNPSEKVSTNKTVPGSSEKVQVGRTPNNSMTIKVQAEKDPKISKTLKINNKRAIEVTKRSVGRAVRLASYTRKTINQEVDGAFESNPNGTLQTATSGFEKENKPTNIVAREIGYRTADNIHRIHKKLKQHHQLRKSINSSNGKAETTRQISKRAASEQTQRSRSRVTAEETRRRTSSENPRVKVVHSGAASENTETVVTGRSSSTGGLPMNAFSGEDAIAGGTSFAGATAAENTSLSAPVAGDPTAAKSTQTIAGGSTKATGSAGAAAGSTGGTAAGGAAAEKATAEKTALKNAGAAAGGLKGIGIKILIIFVTAIVAAVMMVVISASMFESHSDPMYVDDLTEEERYVMTRLIDEGFRAPQVAAIMGNMWGESRFIPYAIESTGEGYGLLQWSFDRKTNLLTYAANASSVYYGNGVPDISTQIDFLVYSDYQEAWGLYHQGIFEDMDDPIEACNYFTEYFVRPEDPAVPRPDREDAALHYYLSIAYNEEVMEDKGVVIHRIPSTEAMYEEDWQFIDSIRGNYLGKPYKLGCAGPSYYDCSGFVSSVLIKAGLLGKRMDCGGLIRQVDCFTDASYAERGDLVFWVHTGNYASWHAAGQRPFDVGHVGIYLGNGYVQHSRPRGGNVITKLRVSNILCFGRWLNHGTDAASLEIIENTTGQITVFALPEQYKRKESWAQPVV